MNKMTRHEIFISVLVNTTWIYVPMILFVFVIGFFFEKFGRMWLISTVCLVLFICGSAITVAIPLCKSYSESRCEYNFSPYILTGLGYSCLYTILYPALTHIAHPIALGTAFGINLSLSHASYSLWDALQNHYTLE